jgi:hypothetical protein
MANCTIYCLRVERLGWHYRGVNTTAVAADRDGCFCSS